MPKTSIPHSYLYIQIKTIVVPSNRLLQLYTVIKKNGVDTKLIWFKNENHNLSRGGRPKSRIKRLTEMVEWMNDYLKEN